MSTWTLVTGCIHVDLPQNTTQQGKVKEYVDWAITRLSRNNHKITGSEGNVTFTVVPDGVTSWCGEKYYGDEYSSASILFNENLRDRTVDRVYKELVDFLDNLSLYCNIDNVSISLNDRIERKHVIGTYDDDTLILDKAETEVCYAMKGEAKENSEGSDQLFRIQYANWLRFYDGQPDDRIREAVDLLSNLSPDKFVEVMEQSKMNRVADFGFTETYVDWCKYAGVKLDSDRIFEECL